jgi:hypothetical protein
MVRIIVLLIKYHTFFLIVIYHPRSNFVSNLVLSTPRVTSVVGFDNIRAQHAQNAAFTKTKNEILLGEGK